MLRVNVDAVLAKLRGDATFPGVAGVAGVAAIESARNHAGESLTVAATPAQLTGCGRCGSHEPEVFLATPATPVPHHRCDSEHNTQVIEIGNIASFATPATPATPQKRDAALNVLKQLHACGVILTPYPDGMLRYKAPKGTLTPALLDALREHKTALHALVEAFEERAAMAEYCGGFAREDAERLAWEMLVQQEVVCPR